MKADDDTYVIVENLRYFLSTQNPDDPVYFGHWFNVRVPDGYHSGGGGYVISREALRRFGEREKGLCKDDLGAEDVHFGQCMHRLGVQPKDSIDKFGELKLEACTYYYHTGSLVIPNADLF